MPCMVLDGAEYSSNAEIVAIYSSESGRFMAFIIRTPAGLLNCDFCERYEDLYFGNRWQVLSNPDSLFNKLEDAQRYIQNIFERFGTSIRGGLPDSYVEFWNRAA